MNHGATSLVRTERQVLWYLVPKKNMFAIQLACKTWMNKDEHGSLQDGGFLMFVDMVVNSYCG